MNSTYFRDYEVEDCFYAGTLNQSSNYVRRTQVNHFRIADLTYKNLSADITDLGAIENQRKVKILGLMGVNLFRHFLFDLNTRDLELKLYRKSIVPVIRQKLHFTVPFKNYGDHLVVEGNLKGKTIKI